MQKIWLLFFLIILYTSGKAQPATKNKPSARKIIEKGERVEKRTNKELQKKSLSKPPILLSVDTITDKKKLTDKFKPVHL